MRLNVRAFAFAARLTASILVLVCAAAVAAAPETTTAFAGDLIHADLSGITRTLTRGSFLLALVVWTGGTAVTIALVAWVLQSTRFRAAGRSIGTDVEQRERMYEPETRR